MTKNETMWESTQMVWSEAAQQYLPKWKLKLNDRERISEIGILQPDMTYAWGGIWGAYADQRLRYMQDERTELLETLLDEGKLLDYLREFQGKAVDMVLEQTEAWMETDPEYRAACEAHDVLLQYQLRENLQARAEELMRDALVYC